MQNNVLKTFIELCSIASPSGEEKRARDYVAGRLKRMGLTVFVDGAGNVFSTKSGSGKPLLLCAHIDTVRPAHDQTPVVHDGVVYSDGSSVLGADDKAAVAAMLEAVEELLKSKKNHRSFEVLFTVREETDGGLRDFPRKRITAQSALIADIGLPLGTIVKAAPYVTGYSVTVRAPGSHVGRFTKDTIHPLSFLAAFIKKHPYGRLRDDTVTNIAIIKMGESYNSVPQELYFTGEIRTHDVHHYADFVPSLQKTVTFLDKALGTDSTLQAFPYCTGYILKDADYAATANILTSLSITPRAESLFSVGDFNILSEWGITPVNIGNDAQEVHTTHEHIAVQSLHILQKIVLSHLVKA